MKIETRLKRLEKRQVARPKVCPLCGYPQRAVSRVVVTEHANPLPTCSGCGQPLDEDGMPVRTPFKRVFLRRRLSSLVR